MDDYRDEEEEYEEEDFGRIREVSWEAPEHHHSEKGSDWFWALGIVTISAAIAMIAFGNVLFGIVILLAGGAVALLASREPRIVTFSVSLRGVRLGNDLHPYSSLKCFYLDEDHPRNVQLLLQSKSLLMPLIVIPVPDDAVDEIEYILEELLPEEHLEESLGHHLLEVLGF